MIIQAPRDQQDNDKRAGAVTDLLTHVWSACEAELSDLERDQKGAQLAHPFYLSVGLLRHDSDLLRIFCPKKGTTGTKCILLTNGPKEASNQKWSEFLCKPALAPDFRFSPFRALQAAVETGDMTGSTRSSEGTVFLDKAFDFCHRLVLGPKGTGTPNNVVQADEKVLQ